MSWICWLLGHDWTPDPSSIKTLPAVLFNCKRCPHTYEKTLTVDETRDGSLLRFILTLKEKVSTDE